MVKKMGRIDILENKLVLHDSILRNISVSENGFVLELNNVFCMNIFDEQKGIKDINLNINITKFDNMRASQHISIYKRKKNNIKEISFDELLKILLKTQVRIYIDYFSSFANSLLLKCNNNQIDIDLEIFDICELCV